MPVVVLAMVPGWQFRGWAWLSLVLASPVALWGAWPFHRAALVNARHGVATMDTLVSIGVIGRVHLVAVRPGHRDRLDLSGRGRGGHGC